MRLAPRMIQSMQILHLPAAELRERVFRELDSNPALVVAESSFLSEDESSSHPLPDVILELADELKWRLRIAVEYLLKLQISEEQTRLQRALPTDSREFQAVTHRIDQARWFIDAIEMRNNTLKRVAEAIVDHQTEFLDRGPEHIAPLKMQQIAEAVSVHVTTVSRAVDGKHIATPRGVFALKHFFGRGTRIADGEEAALNIVRLKLKEIVDGEDKRNPLTDDAIVAELAKQGYQLSRHTVTKYRKAMGIPSARQRRE